jgi:hypothetical protein
MRIATAVIQHASDSWCVPNACFVQYFWLHSCRKLGIRMSLFVVCGSLSRPVGPPGAVGLTFTLFLNVITIAS